MGYMHSDSDLNRTASSSNVEVGGVGGYMEETHSTEGGYTSLEYTVILSGDRRLHLRISWSHNSHSSINEFLTPDKRAFANKVISTFKFTK
jgi:hypothetical protein